MKYTLLIIFIFIGLSPIAGQSYQLSQHELFKGDHDQNQVNIYLLKNTKDTITGFTFYPAETAIDHILEVEELNQFKGFKQKIKAEIYLDGCCTNISTYYFLVDNEDQIHKLPGIENVHCDGPEPKYDLIFPHDRFGIPSTIIKAKIIYNQNFEAENFQEISRIYFQGSNFTETISKD